MAADRWRYNVVEVKPKSVWRSVVQASDLQAELDRQGAQGWELVSMLPLPYPVGLRLVFKRPA
jgi:hypothetical protein